MSIGFFCAKQDQPTEGEIRAAIGPLLPLWDALVARIRETYVCDEDWKFLYGKSYGWGLRFRSKRELLANLYPTEGGLTIQINLSPDGVEQARALAVGPGVPLAIERAKPYPEGRWLFIPVTSEADLRDAEAILALRAEEKRIPRRDTG
ncbi:MAG: DUF3788 family protein [Anaerolineae bacterium]